MSTNLYVGNLSYQTTVSDLEALFGEAGTVTSVNIITDQYTGQSRGFGFVEMSSEEEAQNAISLLNGKTFRDRNLVVNEARPKRNDRNGGDKNRGGYRGKNNPRERRW
ncbi:MAG TPA: RNA-binding protein [Candidatus Limnocylindrales bacterium]|nr:RNA-binding protein [Candidatus Limnocylindrales bacterium]